MSNIIKRTFVANITYNGLTYNTPLIVEYKHTGKIYELYKKGKCIKHTSDNEIGTAWKDLKNHIVKEVSGYYFMYRLAIPNINAKGEKDIWYINNSGDYYRINKLSKYGRKIHSQLTNITEPLNN